MAFSFVPTFFASVCVISNSIAIKKYITRGEEAQKVWHLYCG